MRLILKLISEFFFQIINVTDILLNKIYIQEIQKDKLLDKKFKKSKVLDIFLLFNFNMTQSGISHTVNIYYFMVNG